jgi:hypothetical protein
MDIARFIIDARVSGGLTRDLFGRSPLAGFMVSAHKGFELQRPVLTDTNVREWLTRAWPVLNVPGRYVGAWFDKAVGTWFLDIATNVPNEQDAIALAREHGQLAYWNIAKAESVYLSEVTP